MSEREKARVWEHFFSYAQDIVGGTQDQCERFADKMTREYLAKLESVE